MRLPSRAPRRPCRLGVTELEPRDTPAVGYAAFGAAAGGTPLVDVVRPDGTTLARFEAYEAGFRGGVTAAAGELDGDPGTVEVVTGAGAGGGPNVRVWSVDVGTGAVALRASFFAFEPSFAGGVNVAVGAVTGPSGVQQIVAGAGVGGGPRVRVFDLTTGLAPVRDFLAYEESFRGGVRVAAGDVDGNPFNGDELVVAAGPGGGPRVRVFGADGGLQRDFLAGPADFRGGVNVSVDTSGVAPQLRTDTLAGEVSQRSRALNQAAAAAALTSAGRLGPDAVFRTAFANPAFADALTANGLAANAFFANGALLPGGFTPGVISPFNTAFDSVFGLPAFGGGVFGNALGGVPGLGTLATLGGLGTTTTLPTGSPFGGLGGVPVFTSGIGNPAAVGSGFSAFATGAGLNTFGVGGVGLNSTGVGGVGLLNTTGLNGLASTLAASGPPTGFGTAPAGFGTTGTGTGLFGSNARTF